MVSARLLNKPKEQDILNAILSYLHYRRICVWRNNTGGFKNKQGHFYTFGLKGSGDILGLTKEGRFISIEVKVPGRKPTPNQVQFMETVNANRGLAFVATSVEDVQKHFP